jgi:hypothetical protein
MRDEEGNMEAQVKNPVQTPVFLSRAAMRSCCFNPIRGGAAAFGTPRQLRRRGIVTQQPRKRQRQSAVAAIVTIAKTQPKALMSAWLRGANTN